MHEKLCIFKVNYPTRGYTLIRTHLKPIPTAVLARMHAPHTTLPTHSSSRADKPIPKHTFFDVGEILPFELN